MFVDVEWVGAECEKIVLVESEKRTEVHCFLYGVGVFAFAGLQRIWALAVVEAAKTIIKAVNDMIKVDRVFLI